MRLSTTLISISFIMSLVLLAGHVQTAEAYTVNQYTWIGNATSYRKDPSFVSAGSNFSSILDSVAYEWNSSMGFFGFWHNPSSSNAVTFGSLPPNYVAATLQYTGSDYHWSSFELRLNHAYAWYDGTQAPTLPPNYTDLRSVLRHELGHALGLCHSRTSSQLMYYQISEGVEKYISSDDVDGASYLYSPSYGGSGPEVACELGGPFTVPNVTDTQDDRSSLVSYGGRSDGWETFAPSEANLQTIRRTETVGGKSNITFVGDRISLLYSLSGGRGSAQIFIDDVYQETISALAPQTRRQVIRTWPVPYGTHKFEVRAVGGGNFDVDAFAANIATTYNGYYENNHSQFRYFQAGAWEHLTGIAGTSGGTMSRTRYTGQIARFTFTGSYITYAFSKDINRGKVAVTIDGVPWEIVDMYSPSLLRQQTKTYYVGYGIHVFHLTNIGERHPDATDSYIDIDWIQVQ